MLIVAPKAKTEATRRRIALLNKAGMCQGIERYHGRARGERQVIEGINGVRTIVSIAERHGDWGLWLLRGWEKSVEGRKISCVALQAPSSSGICSNSG